MQSAIHPDSVSTAMLWAGSIVSGVVILFMFVDGVTKLMKVRPVVVAIVPFRG